MRARFFPTLAIGVLAAVLSGLLGPSPILWAQRQVAMAMYEASATDSTPIGTAIAWFSGTTARIASTAYPLPVTATMSGTSDVTISGDALTYLSNIQSFTSNINTSIYADDADFTDGSSAGQLSQAVAESAAPTTVTEGDVGALAMTLNRALKVTLFNSSGTELTTIDPCAGEAKTYYRVDIVTATDVEIANAVASEFFYICSVNLVSAGANNVLIYEDDTDGCGSASAGVSSGGTTAGEGWNFAANGGIAIGNGQAGVLKTTTANRYLCIATSAAVQLSGVISYVSNP